MNVLSPSAVATRVASLLQGDLLLADLWVEGEVSNCRRSGGGHWYWTLKDDQAAVDCVCFRSQASFMTTRPEDGARILLHGQVTYFAPRGRVQIQVDHLEPVGRGDLHRQLEELKARLREEGLFETSAKRALPRYPRRIGVVTSADGAAWRDIRQTLARRWPVAEVLVAPTPVQGTEAIAGLVAAIGAVGRSGADVVIVARGGGSIEDLWAFNSEAVVRAVRRCPVAVIAGVGHETDVTLTDLAADHRASTPTGAAEAATPDRGDLLGLVDDLRGRASGATLRAMGLAGGNLTGLGRRLAARAPERRIATQMAATAAGANRLRKAMVARHERAALGVSHLAGRLERRAPTLWLPDLAKGVASRRRATALALERTLLLLTGNVATRRQRLADLSPQTTFRRGYAHVRRHVDGLTVASIGDVSAGTGLDIRVADGRFDAVAAGQRRLFSGNTLEEKRQ